MARIPLLCLLTSLLTACGGPRFVVDDREYALSPAEQAFATGWLQDAPTEDDAACRYWNDRQADAGTAHSRSAQPVGAFRQLRLWTQAQRIEACTAAGATDQTPNTLPGGAAAEDAPPVEAPPAVARPPAAEDAPPAAEETPLDEDAPPPG